MCHSEGKKKKRRWPFIHRNVYWLKEKTPFWAMSKAWSCETLQKGQKYMSEQRQPPMDKQPPPVKVGIRLKNDGFNKRDTFFFATVCSGPSGPSVFFSVPVFFWWNKNKLFGVLPNQLCFIHVISGIYAICLAVRNQTSFIDSGKGFSFIDHVSTNIWKMLGHTSNSFHRFRNKTIYMYIL